MQKDDFLIKLGRHIVSMRKTKGLTQSDLARKCFKDRQSISRVELGTTNPTSYYLYEIAIALEIHPSKLLDF